MLASPLNNNIGMGNIFKIIYFYFTYVFLNVYACILHVYRVPRRVSDPQGQELQRVMRCLIWVLGTISRSSARTADALNKSVLPSSYRRTLIGEDM